MVTNSLKMMVFLVLLCSFALAIPGIPHQFYGTVTVNGANAPDGTLVVAKIDGVEVSSGTTVATGKEIQSRSLPLVRTPASRQSSTTAGAQGLTSP